MKLALYVLAGSATGFALYGAIIWFLGWGVAALALGAITLFTFAAVEVISPRPVRQGKPSRDGTDDRFRPMALSK